MKVLEAARTGRIKIEPDGKGGAHIEGRRADVERIRAAATKRGRRRGRRLEIAARG